MILHWESLAVNKWCLLDYSAAIYAGRKNFFISVFKESLLLFTMRNFSSSLFSLKSQWHLKWSNWYVASDSCHVTILPGLLLFIECCGIHVSIYLLEYRLSSRRRCLWGWHAYCQCQEGLRPCKVKGEMGEEGGDINDDTRAHLAE